MGNTVCEFNRVFDALSDALCCCGNNKNHSNCTTCCQPCKKRFQNCCKILQTCCPCFRRKQRSNNQGDGFQDNYGDVQCAYNDDYTIDTVCIQGQAMILPPNESTIEPFIADLGGSMGEVDLRDSIRGSLGGNVIYKQPLNVGLLQYHQGQERSEQFHDVR